tara:strand:+ start:670 stop:1164 length:495 start_codon:yes stop_codon:yes gene_type:complete
MKKLQKGFALFYAVVIIGVVVIVAFSIMKITISEVELSSLGKRSQQAFFIANSALECATYWDTKDVVFVSTELSGLELNGYEPGPVYCFGSEVTVSDGVINFDEETFVTSFDATFDDNDMCVSVTVTKDYSNPSKTATSIEASGRDRCSGSSTNQVQRTVIAEY